MSLPLSGTDVRLVHHGYEAHIATVGASLRSLTHHGRELVRGFEAQQLRPVFTGAVLAPWPNRVIDAAYNWDGAQQRLAVTEPDRGHALHGLVLWADFAIEEQAADYVRLSTVISPQQGYPHRVRVEAEYAARERGLVTRVTAMLLSEEPAPFGWGSHSYLVAPGEKADEWTLTLPASTVQHVTDERLVPTGNAPVAGTAFDFRAGRKIGETFIDHAFTDVALDDAGLAHVDVTDAHGVGSRMSWGSDGPWVQIHTGDRPEAELHRTGLAVEPMSCAPGAFNSGEDVIRLEPQRPLSASWVISALE